jgi:hypothetical protein
MAEREFKGTTFDQSNLIDAPSVTGGGTMSPSI